MISDKRRASGNKILINVGSIVFATLVVPNFASGVPFDLKRFVVGIVACVIFFISAMMIER